MTFEFLQQLLESHNIYIYFFIIIIIFFFFQLKFYDVLCVWGCIVLKGEERERERERTHTSGSSWFIEGTRVTLLTWAIIGYRHRLRRRPNLLGSSPAATELFYRYEYYINYSADLNIFFFYLKHNIQIKVYIIFETKKIKEKIFFLFSIDASMAMWNLPFVWFENNCDDEYSDHIMKDKFICLFFYNFFIKFFFICYFCGSSK